MITENKQSYKRLRRTMSGVSSFLMLTAFSAPAFAAGTAVLGGDAVLTGSTRAALNTGSATDSYAQFVANAGAKSAVLDWSKFNIGAGKEMNFSGTGTTFFNLVDGAASKSQIDGIISGNGSVWVINPSGIAFGASSQVNVGGTFAAAAGNLTSESEQAIRGGFATKPVFESITGAVSVNAERDGQNLKMPIFNAGQTVLFGKNVTVKGGVTGDLIVQSGGGIVVDNVGGGLVVVDPAQFAEGDDVFFGDIGLTVYGDLDISANGNVGQTGAVGVLGNTVIRAAGDIDLRNGNNDFSAAGGYLSTIGKSVAVADANGVNLGAVSASQGDVNVTTLNGDLKVLKGAVVATFGDEKSVTLHSSAWGVTGIDQDGVHVTDGDVVVNGTVAALGKDGSVSLKSGVTTKIGETYTFGSTGDVLVNGAVGAHRVTVEARYGDANINGKIVATDQTEQTEGAETPTVQYGRVEVTAGNDSDVNVYYRGDVDVSGSVSAGVVAIGTPRGNATVSGSAAITGEKAVNLNVGIGDITVEEGSTVKVTEEEGNISISAGNTVGYAGKVTINGTVSAEKGGTKTDHGSIVGGITISADGGPDGSQETPVVSIGESASVTANGDYGLVVIEAGDDSDVAGGISVAGKVEALQEINLRTRSGDVAILKTSDGSPTLKVSAPAAAIHITTGKKSGGGGDVAVSGEILNSGSGIVTGEGETEEVEKSRILIETCEAEETNGGITLAEGGAVRATGDDAIIEMISGAEKNTSGDMRIDGKIEISGGGSSIHLFGAYGESAQGNVTVGENGSVVANGVYDDVGIQVAHGTGSSGNIVVDGLVGVYGAYSLVGLYSAFGTSSSGNTVLNGNLQARCLGGVAEVIVGPGVSSTGNATINGHLDAYTRAYVAAAYAKDSSGSLSIPGTVVSGGYYDTVANQLVTWLDDEGVRVEKSNSMIVAGLGEGTWSSLDIGGWIYSLGTKGAVAVDGARGVGSSCDISLKDGAELGTYYDTLLMTWNGNLNVDGKVISYGSSCNRTSVWALSDDKTAGNIFFGADGGIQSDNNVDVVADGSVRQANGGVDVRWGVADVVNRSSAVSGKNINMRVKGDVGDSDDSFFVSGEMRAIVDGNAFFAAANGGNFPGGVDSKPSSSAIAAMSVKADASVADAKGQETSLDERCGAQRSKSAVEGLEQPFSSIADAISVGGDLSIYTAGRLDANGVFSAGGDLTVSASSFGDMSYLQAGGLLTINNVGKPVYPQIAYFETVNGVEPRINNQPNDTVIFVDGRLAGGNLKILNQFGANEAFLVQTPELKSTQGIFGEPTFLHGDLDVATPMAVSAIDYLIQETPLLTLDKDFPKEVDSHIDSVVVPERDSILFGQKAKESKQDGPLDEKEKIAETVSADGKVARAK